MSALKDLKNEELERFNEAFFKLRDMVDDSESLKYASFRFSKDRRTMFIMCPNGSDDWACTQFRLSFNYEHPHFSLRKWYKRLNELGDWIAEIDAEAERIMRANAH